MTNDEDEERMDELLFCDVYNYSAKNLIGKIVRLINEEEVKRSLWADEDIEEEYLDCFFQVASFSKDNPPEKDYFQMWLIDTSGNKYPIYNHSKLYVF